VTFTAREDLDVSDVAAIDRMVPARAAQMGGLDALVVCAGIGVTDGRREPGPTAKMASIDEAAWDRLLGVNVKGAFFACRAAAPLLRKQGGNIVLLGSIDGLRPAPSPPHYAASKGALFGLVQSLAKELGPDGVRINLVAPGVMEAGLSRTLSDELRAQYVKHCGLGRAARLDEVAALVAWLARDNTYVTGQAVVVDGAL
jgi:3-oxoacyl-[acyl-carrier protein] reductase